MLDVRGRRDVASARVLVNATGPWLARFAAAALGAPLLSNLRLDRGSHIVVRKLFEHDRGYIFQTSDGRVVFALPYEQDFTLVGTTDRAYFGDPAEVAPEAEEIDYLSAVVNDHFRKASIAPADVIWSFAGVRALYDDGSSKPQDTPRDYVLTLDAPDGVAPLLTVYGGKITTYRRLAEAALQKLAPILGARPAWTAGSRLPGGEFSDAESFLRDVRARWPFLVETSRAACGSRAPTVHASRRSLGSRNAFC